MDLDTNNRSVFMLQYHLILVIKYRRQVITEPVSERLKKIFLYIAPDYNIVLDEWGHESEHVHILLRGQPNTEMSKFINAYKSASSRLIKKEFPEIKEKLWREHFWSRSFCLLTEGVAPLSVIKKYVETQGEGVKRHYNKRDPDGKRKNS